MSFEDWIIHTLVPPSQRVALPREPAITDGSAKRLPVIVTYGAPDCGWLDITIDVGDQKTTTRFSQCWDPIPDLIEWLEQLVRGESYSTVILDCEGWYSVLVFDAGPTPNTVTFRVKDCWFKEVVHANTVILAVADRRQLVRAFYEPLVAMWKPQDDAFWKSWAYSFDPEFPEETGPRYEVRRALIDEYLRE